MSDFSEEKVSECLSHEEYMRICHKNCINLLEKFTEIILIDKFSTVGIFYNKSANGNINFRSVKNIDIKIRPKIERSSYVMENQCIQLYISGYYLDDIKKICEMFKLLY